MDARGLIEALRDPGCYPHPVERLHLVETHISHVILTGRYAYKIKKPLNLGFLDFSTLEARRACCREEMRLNGRLEPDLYLDVVAITRDATGRLKVGAEGPALEYAVKMRQFDEQGLLDRVQSRGELLPQHIDAVAARIAAFHESCESALAGDAHGSPQDILRPVEQNFAQVEAFVRAPRERERLARLRLWSEAQAEALRATMLTRQAKGFVRECHGDLHLGNMFLEAGMIRIFDRIEFNPSLRWIDVMSDVAFTVMDLYHRDRPDLARRLLNDYLEITGDYDGLSVLSFYLVYRAMVRAKVALIRAGQPEVGRAERRLDRADYRRLIRLAEQFATQRSVWLAITHGPSGAGKSRYARRLVECCGAVRVRTDVERARMQGAKPGSHLMPATEKYSPEATRQTYARVCELAARAIAAGWPVIADATFLERWQRDLAREVAARHGVPACILDFQVPPASLRRRVSARARAGEDASEATVQVLERQLSAYQPLDPDEQPACIVIGERGTPGPRRVGRQLSSHIGALNSD